MEREDILGERRKALEEEFFRKQDQKLREQLRAKQQKLQTRRALAEASGITSDTVLARLLDLGISAETLTPLTLVPLVEVAWADGKVDDRERGAVVRAAEEAGIGAQTVAHAMLESWLRTRPERGLRLAWEDYIRTLCTKLPPAERSKLEQEVLGRARRVAAAAGGFLGLGNKISRAEEAVLAELTAAFSL